MQSLTNHFPLQSFHRGPERLERHLDDLQKKMMNIWKNIRNASGLVGGSLAITGPIVAIVIAASCAVTAGVTSGIIFGGIGMAVTALIVAPLFGLAIYANAKASIYEASCTAKEKTKSIKEGHAKFEFNLKKNCEFELNNTKKRLDLAQNLNVSKDDKLIYDQLCNLTKEKINELDHLLDKEISKIVSQEQEKFSVLVDEVNEQINLFTKESVFSPNYARMNRNVEYLEKRNLNILKPDLFKELKDLTQMQNHIPGLQPKHLKIFWGSNCA